LELAQIYRMWAGVYFFRGETEACFEKSLESLKYARKTDSPEVEARALSALADAEYNRGRFLSAYNYFDQCINLARKYGFGRVIAANMAMRAAVSQGPNDVESSAEDCHAALELARKTSDLWAETLALGVGGRLWAEIGDPVEGRLWVEKALDISRNMRSKLMEGMCVAMLARIEIWEGNYLEAYEHATEAISVLKKSESGMTFKGPSMLVIIACTTNDTEQGRIDVE